MAGGERPEFVFFWRPAATPGHEVGEWLLSQWWLGDFTVDGVVYRSAEHFMMAEKARLFGDDETRARILAAAEPDVVKKLGRAVRGFDQDTWVASRYGIVLRGNVAKFGQDRVLTDFLVGTGDKVLVEASPLDVIWGIGLSADNPKAQDPGQWRGQNLLGFALMDARAALASTAPR